ncbi:carbohydrate kinase family protein [Christensenellaceae bacterium OttesenSCG-928-K19]|nr:carbohydrate kinase family protein [Christensenellaceae bacterium OttesenSCG-928-K19]
MFVFCGLCTLLSMYAFATIKSNRTRLSGRYASGAEYPDNFVVTGVKKMKNGICVAGNAIVDMLYPIERYPKPGELTTIREGISRSTGGALCNVIMDLAQIDPKLPLHAIGIIGDDSEGDFVQEQLARFANISLAGLKRTDETKTSFTAVMSDESTKQRTFFQYRGANAGLCEDDFDWNTIESDLLHIGYILLLDTLDEEDAEYGTKMARLLKSAQQKGIKTSVDIVSETGERFKKLVPPALKYTDYCVINEIETQQATGIVLRDDNDALVHGNIKKALEALFAMGVSTWAVIHSPEGGFAMDSAGNYAEKPSASLPPGYIKGTVGAGDAFCSGVLYAIYSGETLETAIMMGHAAAICSLSQEDATAGLCTMGEALKVYEEYAAK